jgi:hypothetical protein
MTYSFQKRGIYIVAVQSEEHTVVSWFLNHRMVTYKGKPKRANRSIPSRLSTRHSGLHLLMAEDPEYSIQDSQCHQYSSLVIPASPDHRPLLHVTSPEQSTQATLPATRIPLKPSNTHPSALFLLARPWTTIATFESLAPIPRIRKRPAPLHQRVLCDCHHSPRWYYTASCCHVAVTCLGTMHSFSCRTVLSSNTRFNVTVLEHTARCRDH